MDESVRAMVAVEEYFREHVWPALRACLDRAVSTGLHVCLIIHKADTPHHDS